MSYVLRPLPYPQDALEPYIGARTVNIHYEKHHGGYVDKLNAALERDKSLAGGLERLVKTLGPGKPFNFAAQIWNHEFYWESMGPEGGGEPEGELGKKVKEDFGSAKRLKAELAQAGSGEFGSGWAWLIVDGDAKLRVLSTTDAENPLQDSLVPLLAIDVWEHAYYLDFQNEREKYLEAFLDHLVRWDFAAANLMKWREAVKAADEVT